MSAFSYPSTSTTPATPSPRNSQMTYPGPLTSRFPSSQLAQRLTHQAWETIGLFSAQSSDGLGGPDAEGPADHGTEAPTLNTENNDAVEDEEFEVIVEQIASVLEYRLAEIVKQRKEAEHDSGRSTPTGGGGGSMARRMSNDGVNPRRRLSNESLDRARRRFSNEGAVRRRLSNDSHTSAGSGGSNRSAGRMRRRHSTSSVDVIYVSPMCRAELREYVRRIGRRYRPCRYHSFRHAAHVTVSANKLLDLLEERMLTPEEYDCCTYIPETEQLYDCASSSSIELDHKFQRELRRLSIASRASSRRGSNVSSRRGSNVSAATGSNGGEFSSGSRRGSNASGLGGGPTWRRRSSTGTNTSYSAYRRRSSAAGSAAVRRGSMSSIMSVAVSEADVDSILSPSIVSDTSSQQRMRRRMTQEHVRTTQGSTYGPDRHLGAIRRGAVAPGRRPPTPMVKNQGSALSMLGMPGGNPLVPTAPRRHLLPLPYMAGLLDRVRVQKVKDGSVEGTASTERPVMYGNRAAPMVPQLKKARPMAIQQSPTTTSQATEMTSMPMPGLVWRMIRTASSSPFLTVRLPSGSLLTLSSSFVWSMPPSCTTWIIRASRIGS